MNPEHMSTPEHKRLFEVETFTQPQTESRKGRLNEDTLVYLEDTSGQAAGAVFDGATSIDAVTNPAAAKEQGGRFAALATAEGIGQAFRDNPELSAKELALAANEYLNHAYQEQGIDPNKVSALELSRASGSVVKLDKAKQKIEIAHVGECAALIVYTDGRVELAAPVDVGPHDQEAVEKAMKFAQQNDISLSDALKHPQIASEIAAMMRQSQLTNNSPDGKGSGVFNGNKHIEQYIQVKTAPFSEVKEIILVSDGMWLPTKEFNADPDWQTMYAIIKKEGIKGLYQTVQDMENSDPGGLEYPRWKKHDDATVVRIIL